MPAQYGEDAVFAEIFKGKQGGVVVEAGAANGVDNSNSHILITEHNWTGILIEPEPEAFDALDTYYAARQEHDVWLCPNACGTREGTETFYCGGQASTLDIAWRDRCIDRHQIPYTEVQVEVKRLDRILDWFEIPTAFDLLSIDCEGRDMDVLASIDLDRYKPAYICIDAKGALIAGYTVLHATRGNVIYKRD